MYTDAHIEYWGRVFIRAGLASYLTFEQFVADPLVFLSRLKPSGHRPLLASQRAAQRRADAEAIEADLTPATAELRDGALVEPLRHHAYRVSADNHLDLRRA